MIPTPVCGIIRCNWIEYRILLKNSLYVTNSLIREFFFNLFLFLFFLYLLFILAVPGLSCSTWDLRCGMQDLLVVA